MRSLVLEVEVDARQPREGGVQQVGIGRARGLAPQHGDRLRGPVAVVAGSGLRHPSHGFSHPSAWFIPALPSIAANTSPPATYQPPLIPRVSPRLTPPPQTPPYTPTHNQ